MCTWCHTSESNRRSTTCHNITSAQRPTRSSTPRWTTGRVSTYLAYSLSYIDSRVKWPCWISTLYFNNDQCCHEYNVHVNFTITRQISIVIFFNSWYIMEVKIPKPEPHRHNDNIKKNIITKVYLLTLVHHFITIVYDLLIGIKIQFTNFRWLFHPTFDYVT